MKIIILIFIYTIYFAYLKVYTMFIILHQAVVEKTDEKCLCVLYRSDRRKVEKNAK